MPAGRVEAVLLDMGGVLVPDLPHYERAARDPILCRELREAGIKEPEQLVADGSQRLIDAYRALAPEATQPDLDAVFSELTPQVRGLLLDAYRRETAELPPPYVRDIIEQLARSYRLGLVSNTIIPGDHHARALEDAGVLRYLGAAVWSANFGRRKPDPAMLLHVLGELEVAAEHAVLVGDKIRTDVLAATRAGMRAIWLRTPADTPHTGEAEPDFIIHDLRELPDLLQEIG